MTNSDYASATKTAKEEIPVIDVAPAVDGSDIPKVAAEIYAAATEHGFFYISGHGIAPDLMDRAFAVSKEFFALSEQQKRTVQVNTNQRGWMAQGMSQLPGAKTHDLKEVFFWGKELSADDPDIRAGLPLMAVNLWPEQVCPNLRRDLLSYHNAVCEVGRKIMAAIAVSLGQDVSFFEKMYEKPLARGQLVYYPQSTELDENEERFGVAPHTDFGVLTMLLQDRSGGLQVLSKSGRWIEAPPIEGTLVCNIGDLLARWSNDRFASTQHRVINRSGNARYSIPVFFDPHTSTIVDPFDFGLPKSDCRYPPVRVGEHIVARNKKSFSQYEKGS